MFRKSLVLVGLSLVTAFGLSGCGGKTSTVDSGVLTVTVTAASSTVDGADTVTLTAAVANDENSRGVVWNVTGPGTLSNQTTTSATYTAPAATSSAQTITITANSIAEITKSGTTTITVAPLPAITTASSALAGNVGTPYSVQLAGSGGISPYTWTVVSGSTLPAGLTLSTAGLISGTPTAASAGTTNVQFQMKDSGTPTALVETQKLDITIATAPAIRFNGTMPAAAAINQAYTGSAAATGGGGALTYTLYSGALPTGLTLNAATGAVTGIATAGGTYSFTIKATDAFGDSATQAYQIIVSYAAVTLTPGAGSLPIAVTGQTYSQTLTASGGSGTGYTWTISGLSNGLTYAANGPTLTINGPPSTAGTVNFSAMVTDGSGNSSGAIQYSIQVYSPVTLPSTIPASLRSTATVNAAYSGTVAAAGGSGNYSWTVTGQSDGLNTSTSGGTLTVSGTPTSPGTVSLSVSVKDTTTGVTAGPYLYAITVSSQVTLPAPNPASLGAAVVSAPYTGTIVAAGGSGNYSWTVTGLPAGGLSYSAVGGTLTISGTPGSPGTVSFGVSVKDTSTNTTVGPFTYSVTVYNPLTLPTPNPASLGPADSAASYSGTITASGGSGNYTWTVTGLSDGLNSSPSGGTLTISGSPTAAMTVSFSVTLKDATTNLTAGPYTYSILVYGALTLPSPDPSSLPGGFTSVPYTGAINATGGSGNYSWQVTGLSDNLSSTPSGGTLNISGTPAPTPATVTFNVTLKDNATGLSITQNGYSISISTPVSLPAPNPASLPQAVVNQAYTGSISASGGVNPFTWSVNGTPIPNSNAPVAIADGLMVSNNGGNVLVVSGTPTATQTVNLTNVKVTDNVGSTQTSSYTIVVSAVAQVSGQISLNNNCGGTLAPPPITVNLLTSPGGTIVQSVTTDSNGNFTFTGVSFGNYTISPTISGASSLFYPATQSLSVNSNVSGENFNVALGYTVSGSVSYGGTNSGQIYLALVPSNNCGVAGTGTSIITPGAFTIRGVAPGTYTLQAWMDLTALANGAQNTSDPSGSTAGIAVTSANLTGQSISITDNTPASVPGSNPALNAITPTDQGVAISFKPVATNGVEAATSYDVQWSTSSTFSAPTSTYNFKAIGTGSDVWILNNGTSGISGSPFSDGQTYYFEARARNAAGPASGWTVYGGGTPTGVTVGASTSGNLVQGTVTVPAGITPTGPLYVGYYNQSTNTVYGTRIASPGSSNPFTVYVPTDPNSDYVLFALLDQNNNGLIDAGDVTNTRNNNSSGISITGPLTGQNLTLPTASSAATVSTQYYENTINDNGNAVTLSGYNLNFDLRQGNKLPVAVTLMSGPNVINPVDINNDCQGCGSVQFQYLAAINGATPNVGDSYTLQVTYNDASSETITGSVTGWDTTGTLAGPNNIPGDLQPGFIGPLIPDFSWTVPPVDSNDLFAFYLYDNNGNTVWQVPSANSNSNGFPSSITELTYGTDPANAGNDLPPGTILNDEIQYTWMISAQDSNGNQAQGSVYFTPSGVL